MQNRMVSASVVFALLAALAACQSPPTSHQLDQQLMTAETSPIPGAQARVLPAAAGETPAAAGAAYCVTDAGYCPLRATVPAGRNCICTAGSMMYGGKTGTAPQTYQPP